MMTKKKKLQQIIYFKLRRRYYERNTNNKLKRTYWTNLSQRYSLIDKSLFPFITWESGKAWSKSELMELEVGE
jgi:hypothetical protein